MSPIGESLIVFAVLLGGACIGLIANLLLPDHHRSDGTRTHFAATVSVVATLAALVLGLAISNANTSRGTMIQDLALMSSDITRIDHHLRHFGPDADNARHLLAGFARQKRDDLFPPAPGVTANPDNLATAAKLDDVQTAILALTPHDDAQKWRQAQALDLAINVETVRWAIAEQEHVAVPQAVVGIVSFWLAVLFGTYGLFMPRHVTAFVAMVLSAAAVASAIFLILEARTPFTGLVHIPAASLDAAVAGLDR
jgi:hypothetical protein